MKILLLFLISGCLFFFLKKIRNLHFKTILISSVYYRNLSTCLRCGQKRQNAPRRKATSSNTSWRISQIETLSSERCSILPIVIQDITLFSIAGNSWRHLLIESMIQWFSNIFCSQMAYMTHIFKDTKATATIITIPSDEIQIFITCNWYLKGWRTFVGVC